MTKDHHHGSEVLRGLCGSPLGALRAAIPDV
jgi:hypothetical protein